MKIGCVIYEIPVFPWTATANGTGHKDIEKRLHTQAYVTETGHVTARMSTEAEKVISVVNKMTTEFRLTERHVTRPATRRPHNKQPNKITTTSPTSRRHIRRRANNTNLFTHKRRALYIILYYATEKQPTLGYRRYHTSPAAHYNSQRLNSSLTLYTSST